MAEIPKPPGFKEVQWLRAHNGRITGFVICEDHQDAGKHYAYIGSCLNCTDLDIDFVFKTGCKLPVNRLLACLSNYGRDSTNA